MHVRRHTAEADVTHAVEFADLLDPIRTTPFAAPLVAASTIAGSAVDADIALADMLVADMIVPDQPVSPVGIEPELLPGPSAELVVVSRFADAVVDDDRLPLHPATKRFRRR